jgi:predicted GH43/DUF377 family glycosyl hydrolase
MMLNKQFIYLLKIVICGSFISNTFAQTQWTKYANNPVHLYGGQPSVILDNDTFKMWYARGTSDSLGLKIVVCYATSTNGIEWTDHPDATLDCGEPGTWDSRVRDTPYVIKDPYGYKLWYLGADHIGYPWSDSLTLVFGFATSSDGLHWDVWPEPVLKKGHTDSWDAVWLESPAVIYEDGLYKMWYTGMTTEGGKARGQIGYATSTDGIDWDKHPDNPLVNVGGEGSGEDYVVGACTVIKRDSLYEMWYGGMSRADMALNEKVDTVNVGYATSSDGIYWQKYHGNPVMTTYSPTYDPDSGGPWAPCVLFIDSEYRMWYESGSGISLATAPLSGIKHESDLYSELSQEVKVKIWPNPFSRMVEIRCQIPQRAQASLKIYDLLGRPVRNLFNEIKGADNYQLDWDGCDIARKRLPDGIYFCRLKVGDEVSTKKLILIS